MRCRTILWYLVFTGSTLNMIIMSNMNIAMVAMVKKVSSLFIEAMNETIACGYTHNSGAVVFKNVTPSESDKLKLHQSTFDWNGHEQSMVLGSIYWLAWITHIPGGIFANKFGPKLVFGLSNFLASILSFLTPMATYFDIYALIALRVVQGIVVGLTFPCLHTITARWIPPNERGSFITSYLGGALALAFGYPIFGWIMTVRRWDDIFYTTGWLGVTWSVVWYFLMFDSPSQHPRIRVEEKQYIEKSLGVNVAKKPLTIPWNRLISSVQVWLNVTANFSFMWIFFLAQIYFPMFLRMVHHMQFSSTALISGLPHLLRIFASLLSSISSDYLLRTERLSRTNVRKISTTICILVTAIFLIGLAYSGCNIHLAIGIIFALVTCTSLPNSGFYAAMVDIAPNFCSIIYGIALTAGTLSGIMLTSYVGWMTHDNYQSVEQWQKIFLFVAVIGCFTGIIYFIFAKAEVLDWNNDNNSVVDTEMKDLSNNNRTTEEEQPLKQL